MSEDKSNTPNSKPTNKKREKKPPKKITQTYLHNSGLYYLERFAASKNHFIAVMTRKVKRSCYYHKDQNYEECIEMVQALANKFEKADLLNDEAYLRGMITSYRRRGLSRKVIMAKLATKGLDISLVSEFLQHFDDREFENVAEAEFLSALKQARKKRIGPFDIFKKKDPEKAMAALARNGFSYDIVKKVMDLDENEANKLCLSCL